MTPGGVSSDVPRTLATRLAPLAMLMVAALGQPALEVAHSAAHWALSHDEAAHEHHNLAPVVETVVSESGAAFDHAEPEHPHADADQLGSPGARHVAPVPAASVAVRAPLRGRPPLPPGAPPIPFQHATAARPPTRAPPISPLGFRPTSR